MALISDAGMTDSSCGWGEAGRSARPGAKLFGGGFAGRAHDRAGVVLSITVRGDGAVAINRGSPDDSERNATPVIFRFRLPAEAEAVVAGALRRLAGQRRVESGGWLFDASAGEVAAAIKAEAKGLSFSFAVIHPLIADGPVVSSRRQSRARRVAAHAPYALLLGAGALVGLVVGLMLKSF